jgi:hypothetical protein
MLFYISKKAAIGGVIPFPAQSAAIRATIVSPWFEWPPRLIRRIQVPGFRNFCNGELLEQRLYIVCSRSIIDQLDIEQH